MDMRQLFDFLRDLSANNSKAWMDEHRDRYQTVRESLIDWLDGIDGQLLAIDADYLPTPGRAAINRINNNLVYRPNRPVYKDHFGASFDKAKERSDFYVHLGITECFIAGGFYHPPSTLLKRIRAGIDYDGEHFKEIIEAADFKKTFGSLLAEDLLKTAPKGYTQDHRHIELLRYKSFAISHSVPKAAVLEKDFADRVVAVYQQMLPFRRYLDQAVTVKA